MLDFGKDGKFFGTDGIRGLYGEELTDGLAMLLGNALGSAAKGGHIVIGRDTRPSGENLARAVAEGAMAAGADVADLGIVTTPCVAFATRASGAAGGVMVSASHNPARYNGLKVFLPTAEKLPRDGEERVERHLARGRLDYAERRGSPLPAASLKEDYISAVCARAGRLSGLRIVLDCACGAASAIAPEVFERAGAEVHATSASLDGAHINDGCGALHPQVLAEAVRAKDADLGLSFDGDADRVIACDEQGNVVDGDGILYVLARDMLKRGALPFSAAVGTLHTNMGAEAALKESGITLVRTDIGDHNVTRCMLENGYAIGAEQSGHVILGDFLPTGDGVLAGAALAAVVRGSGRELSSLAAFRRFPQCNAEVVTEHKFSIAADAELARFADAVRGMLGEDGRIMLRGSGTEPKLRIMAESKDAFLASFAARAVELFVRTHYSL